jgi:hypothetical protein
MHLQASQEVTKAQALDYVASAAEKALFQVSIQGVGFG